jgi:hypothetical protein
MYKLATVVIEMGEPSIAGRGIADIIKFLMRRIEPEKRQEAFSRLRNKIWGLNEIDISSKETPSSASLGQSITFLKTILNGHKPHYIRAVLSSVVKYLH